MEKCVIISNEYPPDRGGVSDYTDIFSKELSKRNFEVHVVTSKVHKGGFNGRVDIVPLFGMDEEVIDYVSGLKPDIVNLQYVPFMYSKYGWNSHVAGILKGIKGKVGHVATTFHETYVEPIIHRPKALILSLIQYVSYKKIVSESDMCFVSVQYYKDIAPEKYQNRFRVLPVGSNIIGEYPLKLENIQNERFTIAIFGAYFHPYRRFDTILEAISKMPAKIQTGVKLLILGEIGLDNKFMELLDSYDLEADVEITGRLSREEALRRLSGSDLFMMFEQAKGGRGGVGLRNGSLLAALSANLPCLINTGEHTDDNLRDICYTVDTLDTSAISEKIVLITKDKDTLWKKRAAINEYYTRCLHWDKIVGSFLNYIK